MERKLEANGDGILIAHGKNAFQKLRLFVPEHDAEDVVVDHFLDAFGNAVEKFFAFQDGGELAAHLVEKHQRLRLLRMREKEALRYGIGITQKGETLNS